MPTRKQVQDLVRSGVEYDEIGERLGISPGLAYLIATGLPADGSDTPDRYAGGPDPGGADGAGRLGQRPSSQALANPAQPENPTRKESVIGWISWRASGDRQMQEAAARRDAAPGEKEIPEGGYDIVDVLGRDHNQVKALLEQMSAIPGKRKGGSAAQISARKSIADMITVALSQHESAEEELFWPAVRKSLPDGDARRDKALAQEQQGKDVLAALGKLDGNTDEFDELVEQLTLLARTHVAFEETVFLDLVQHMDEQQRQSLGKAVVKAKKLAPTRPHPHAPKRMPAVAAAGAPAAAMDKVRDALGDRPAKQRGKQRTPSAGAPTGTRPGTRPDKQSDTEES